MLWPIRKIVGVRKAGDADQKLLTEIDTELLALADGNPGQAPGG